MQLLYDEDLIEAVVFLCANGQRKEVPPLQVARFHRARERAYGISDPDERNAEFFRVHLEWFREWGLEKLLLDSVGEFPLLSKTLNTLAIRKTRGKNDEGAELYVNENGERNAMIVLQPEWIIRDVALQNYLRHEFMHLRDMLDPAFAYSPALESRLRTAAEQRLVGERYRLLWDITIDGRLAVAGRTPKGTREDHQRAFTRAYAFWPADKQAKVFASLWHSRAPRHADLVELAADPRGLREAHRPTPGAACPLCAFPTFDWVNGDRLRPEVLARIVEEFPSWSAEHGLCGRCHEAYQALISSKGSQQ
jgi:hypothetical protein